MRAHPAHCADRAESMIFLKISKDFGWHAPCSSGGMSDTTLAVYQVDARWRIIGASEQFCRTLHCTESSLVGRDARELLRDDWRTDFRHYVARALVGLGQKEVTVPLVAPCGKQGWFKHEIEPLIENGMLEGFRASIRPQAVATPATTKPWWEWRPSTFHQVWDFDAEQLAEAS